MNKIVVEFICDGPNLSNSVLNINNLKRMKHAQIGVPFEFRTTEIIKEVNIISATKENGQKA